MPDVSLEINAGEVGAPEHLVVLLEELGGESMESMGSMGRMEMMEDGDDGGWRRWGGWSRWIGWGGCCGLNMPPPCRRRPRMVFFSVHLPTPHNLLLAFTPAFFSANVSPFQAGEEELQVPVCPSSSSSAPCSRVTASLGLTANGAAGRPPDPRETCLRLCARGAAFAQ